MCPYCLADVPAVVRGEGHFVEQFVPLGELVAGLAWGGTNRAGVQAADVGKDCGDFAWFQGGELLRFCRFIEGGEEGGHVCLGAGHASCD